MIKKRSRPQPHQREAVIETAEEDHHYSNTDLSDIKFVRLFFYPFRILIALARVNDLLQYRKFRKLRQGIDVGKLNKGELGRKRQHSKERLVNIVENTWIKETDNIGYDGDKAKSMIKSNNFTQQTNALDVDKHMMAYIEENLKVHRGERSLPELNQDKSQDNIFSVPSKFSVENALFASDEGSVTNSLAMLTAIPEVDLGMNTRLKNIEETEKAKRALVEGRKERNMRKSNDEEYLVAARFYKAGLQHKSDLDIKRDANWKAMGIPLRADKHESRSYYDRNLVSSDELVE